MKVLEYSSETSAYYEQIRGTAVFYSFLHDAETALRKGENATHA